MSAARTAMASEASTLTADPAAEDRIGVDLALIRDRVRRALGPRLAGLWLLGGYARGEGSIVLRDGAPAPYNDYDLVAVVHGDPRAHRATLVHVSETLGPSLGVEVDLWPIGVDELPHLPPTLFWFDAALGGLRVLDGPASLTQPLLRMTSRRVPLEECGRLLANRAVGLALSNLEREVRDLRRARHGHKAVLACGDAMLLAANRYQPTVAARSEELRKLQGCPSVEPDLVEAYAEAVRFRVRPDAWRPAAGVDEAQWYGRIVDLVGRHHLAFEALRTGSPGDALGFAAWRGRLFANLTDTTAALVPLTCLRLAVRGTVPLRPWVGHPRERLARVAVALAYGASRADCRARAAELMGLPSDRAMDDAALHARLVALSRVGG